MTFCPPILHLGTPERSDAGVEDALDPSAGGGVGEYLPGQFIATQMAIRPEDFSAKGLLDLSEARLAGLNKLPSQVVGVHHPHPAVAEEPGRSGFAHANTAR